jgi:hypothetical protein
MSSTSGETVPRQGRTELAGGEVVGRAKASGEFGGVQLPLAVELAEKNVRWFLTLLRVAFQVTRNQVAEGIASRPHPGHDVSKIEQF